MKKMVNNCRVVTFALPDVALRVVDEMVRLGFATSRSEFIRSGLWMAMERVFDQVDKIEVVLPENESRRLVAGGGKLDMRFRADRDRLRELLDRWWDDRG